MTIRKSAVTAVYLLPRNCIVCITKTFSRRRVSIKGECKPATWKPQYSNASVYKIPHRSSPLSLSSPSFRWFAKACVERRTKGRGPSAPLALTTLFRGWCTFFPSPIIVGRTAKMSHKCANGNSLTVLSQIGDEAINWISFPTRGAPRVRALLFEERPVINIHSTPRQIVVRSTTHIERYNVFYLREGILSRSCSEWCIASIWSIKVTRYTGLRGLFASGARLSSPSRLKSYDLLWAKNSKSNVRAYYNSALRICV